MKESNIILYETEDGKINVDVILKDETIWLTQKSMAELFGVDRTVVTKHLKNIFAENEYEKYRIKQDKEYISSMDMLYNKYLKEEIKIN